MSVNKAIIMGNLGKDPVLKYTPAGKAVCNFSIATTERWTGQDGNKNEATTWHNIVAWGKQAEVMAEHLVKGQQVYIEGRIANRSYEKKDGTKGYISEIVVQSFQFVGNKSDSPGNGTAPSTQPPSAPPVGNNDLDDVPF